MRQVFDRTAFGGDFCVTRPVLYLRMSHFWFTKLFINESIDVNPVYLYKTLEISDICIILVDQRFAMEGETG